MLIVGADIGKYRVKLRWKMGVGGHLSRVATYREIKDNVVLDANNMIVEFENQTYLVGDLAEREGQVFFNSNDVHKSNLVTLVNLLVGLSKLPSTDFKIVIGNPFGINTDQERNTLKELLRGDKEFKVNHQPQHVKIHNVGVGAEGVVAYYSEPNLPDDLNIFDFGSTTIHAISIRKRKLVDKRSHTFDFGFESLLDHDYGSLMYSLKSQMEKRWNDGNHKILCVGGKAPEMFQHVAKQYPDSNVTIHRDYQHANSIGLYRLGEIIYGQNEANS